MRAAIRLVFPLLLLGFLGGCSVFGIATKGELQQQNEAMNQSLADQQKATSDRMARVSRSVDERVAEVSGQLEAIELELLAAMATLDSRSEETANDVADIQVHFEIIQGQVQLALADLASVAEAASRAEAGSQQAVRLHKDATLAERERLQERLFELETRITAWTVETVPGDQLQRRLQSELQERGEIQSASVAADGDGSILRPGLQIPDNAREGRQR